MIVLSEDNRPVEGDDFDKILVLALLKMLLIFLPNKDFIPLKEIFWYKFSCHVEEKVCFCL